MFRSVVPFAVLGQNDGSGTRGKTMGEPTAAHSGPMLWLGPTDKIAHSGSDVLVACSTGSSYNRRSRG